MEPIDYLRVVRRRWRMIGLICVIGVVAAWVTTPAHAATERPIEAYEATHILLVDRSVRASVSAQTLDQLALLVRAGEVPRRVAAELGHDDPAVLASQITVVPDEKVGSISVMATRQDGQEAAKVADAFARGLAEFLYEDGLRNYQASLELTTKRLTKLEDEIKKLDEALKIARPDTVLIAARRDAFIRQYSLTFEQYQDLAEEGAPPSGVITLQEASPVPVLQGGFRPPASRGARIPLAAGLALFLGTALAFVLERFDVRARSKEEAEEVFGLPVIAEVPALGRRQRENVVVVSDPDSTAAESYRALRAALLMMPASRSMLAPAREANGSTTAGESGSVILVTSAAPDEGKTSTVGNLAAAFAELGRSVLVVNCDFRRSSINKLLDVPNVAGLSEVIAETTPQAGENGHGRLQAHVRPSSIPGVRLLTKGQRPMTPSGVMAVREVIAEARRLADVVILDTGPLLVVSDVAELLPVADVVVLTAWSGRTTFASARRTRQLLERLDVHAFGVVLFGALDMPAHDYVYLRNAPEENNRLWRRVVNGRTRWGDADAVPPPAAPVAPSNGGPAGPATPGRPVNGERSSFRRSPKRSGDRR